MLEKHGVTLEGVDRSEGDSFTWTGEVDASGVDPRMVEDQVLAPQLWGTALEGLAPGSRCECRLDLEVGP